MRSFLPTLSSFFLTIAVPPVSAHEVEQSLVLPQFCFGYGNTWGINEKYSNWLTEGSTEWDYEFLQVTKEYGSSAGAAWSQNQIHLDSVQFQFELTSRHREGAKNSRGTAFWLVDAPSFSRLMYTPGAGPYQFYGYRGDFRGIGVFFATTDPSGKPAESISAVIADGSSSWDYKNLPTSDGIFAEFRNATITMKITIENSIVTAWYKGKTQETFVKAFQLLLPPTIFTNNDAYVGFGSVNSPVQVGEPDQAAQALFGDQVTVRSLTTSALNVQSMAAQAAISERPARLMEKVLAGGNDAELTTALLEVLVKHVIPRQEVLQQSLGRLLTADRDLHGKIDVLRAISSQDGSTKWTEAVSEVRKLFMNAQEEQVEKIGRVHGAMQAESVREMLKHSEVLKDSLAQATKRTTYLSLGFGSIFVLMIIGIYVRMREMEKKHIL